MRSQWWHSKRAHRADFSPYNFGYVTVASFRNLLMGVVLFFFADQFMSPGYDNFFRVLPAEAWAILLAVSGGTTLVALIRKDTLLVRVGLLLGVAVLASMTLSISIALISGADLGGRFGPIIYASLCLKDVLLILSPFVDVSQHGIESREHPPKATP